MNEERIKLLKDIIDGVIEVSSLSQVLILKTNEVVEKTHIIIDDFKKEIEALQKDKNLKLKVIK